MMCPPATIRLELGLLVARLARVWRRAVDQSLLADGLSEATAQPLMILFRTTDKCARPGEIAKAMGIEGPSLVRLIDLLEAEGLVKRREDQADRRARVVYLTALGKKKAARANRVVRRIRAELLEGIRDEEVAVTFDVLRRIELRADPSIEIETAGDQK